MLAHRRGIRKYLCFHSWGSVWLSHFLVVGLPAYPALCFMSLICQWERAKGPSLMGHHEP